MADPNVDTSAEESRKEDAPAEDAAAVEDTASKMPRSEESAEKATNEERAASADGDPSSGANVGGVDTPDTGTGVEGTKCTDAPAENGGEKSASESAASSTAAGEAESGGNPPAASGTQTPATDDSPAQRTSINRRTSLGGSSESAKSEAARYIDMVAAAAAKTSKAERMMGSMDAMAMEDHRPEPPRRKSSLIQQLMPKFSRSSLISSPDDSMSTGRRSLAFSESLTESSKRLMRFGSFKSRDAPVSPGSEERNSRRLSRGMSLQPNGNVDEETTSIRNSSRRRSSKLADDMGSARSMRAEELGIDDDLLDEVDINTCLRHAIYYRHFMEHLQKEYNSENLMFWKACQDYIKKFNTSKGKAAAFALAKTIYTSYIEDGAALQVNISSSAQTKIADNFEKELIDVHIFDAALSQVFAMLRDDLFPRFRKSPAFRQMLA